MHYLHNSSIFNLYFIIHLSKSIFARNRCSKPLDPRSDDGRILTSTVPLMKLPQTSTNQIYLASQSLVKTSLSYFESQRKIFTHTFVRACIIFSRTRLPGACRRTDVCGYEIIDQVHQIAGTSGSLEFQFRLTWRGVRSFVDLGPRNTKKAALLRSTHAAGWTQTSVSSESSRRYSMNRTVVTRMNSKLADWNSFPRWLGVKELLADLRNQKGDGTKGCLGESTERRGKGEEITNSWRDVSQGKGWKRGSVLEKWMAHLWRECRWESKIHWARRISRERVNWWMNINVYICPTLFIENIRILYIRGICCKKII